MDSELVWNNKRIHAIFISEKARKIAGNKVAINDPMLGMKFKRKIKKAQKTGESIPTINKTIKLSSPVVRLVNDFIPR